MKLHGKKISAPKSVVIAIPREDGDLIFMAQPIVDYKEFEKFAPEPQPTRVMKPGVEPYDDYRDPSYIRRLEEHATLRTCWLVVKSLEATDGLEWELVKMDDPSTWDKYQVELETSGLTKAEQMVLLNKVLEANMLTEDKIKEARERFFANQPNPFIG